MDTCGWSLRPRGSKQRGRILVLGHSDTVWPMGTLAGMPFRQERGRLWGPGVLDMKSGLAFFVFAMRAIRELEIPLPHKVVLQLNADEEVGSTTSRALTEEAARRSGRVLVLEPGTGLEGQLQRTARKGTRIVIASRCTAKLRTPEWISRRARAPSSNWRARSSASPDLPT